MLTFVYNFKFYKFQFGLMQHSVKTFGQFNVLRLQTYISTLKLLLYLPIETEACIEINHGTSAT